MEALVGTVSLMNRDLSYMALREVSLLGKYVMRQLPFKSRILPTSQGFSEEEEGWTSINEYLLRKPTSQESFKWLRAGFFIEPYELSYRVVTL